MEKPFDDLQAVAASGATIQPPQNARAAADQGPPAGFPSPTDEEVARWEDDGGAMPVRASEE